MSRRLPAIAATTIALAVVTVAAAVAALWWQRSQGGTNRASIGPSTIVLLGDSLTEEGDWEALLPDRFVSNQGYSGFTSEQLVPVAASVAADGPRVVVVLAGTNDIRDGHGPDWTIGHLDTILDRLLAAEPEPTIVLQTLLPRADAPAEVVAVNERIAALADRRGVVLLDLHPEFDDGTGGLRAAETRDGLHLSDAGYRRWVGLLDAVLDRELGSG